MQAPALHRNQCFVDVADRRDLREKRLAFTSGDLAGVRMGLGRALLFRAQSTGDVYASAIQLCWRLVDVVRHAAWKNQVLIQDHWRGFEAFS